MNSRSADSTPPSPSSWSVHHQAPPRGKPRAPRAFRHYLELSLKYIIWHSRWLQDQKTLAKAGEMKPLENTHSLTKLWDLVKAEALPKIENDAWKEWDIEFVAECVKEFDAVDPGKGVRFRYHGKTFGGPQPSTPKDYLGIDFDRLLESMPHVREVLGMVDIWLYETTGLIAEWEAEMASW